jgi:hypothetical protein
VGTQLIAIDLKFFNLICELQKMIEKMIEKIITKEEM